MPRRHSCVSDPRSLRSLAGGLCRAISVVAGGAVACVALGVASVAPAGAVSVAPAGAAPSQAGDPTSTTVRRLPRTGLEAEELDQGADGGAGWMAASAVAAGVVVLGGGLVLKRRMDREDQVGGEG